MRVTIGSYKNFDDGERDRKIQVRIDPWDTWNMDQTLSYIILPMLKQLRATKHGAPNVDIEDCPDHLKPTTKEIAAHKNAGEVAYMQQATLIISLPVGIGYWMK